MMDMVSMVKKAQAVQTQMAAVQNKMENTEFTGLAADGAVQVTMTGKLEDLLLVAMKNAKTKIDDASDKAFDSIKKSLNLPENFELPF